MFGWLKKLSGSGFDRKPDKEFYGSIAGVDHRNRDRTSRQKIIRESLRPGMVLELQFEDDNPVDKNAVALVAPGDGQVGYLHSHLASDVRDWVSDGMRVTAAVAEITGGTRDKPTHGVNILVRVYENARE